MSDLETASRSVIAAHQLARLQAGFSRILPHNRFYHQKLNVRAGLAPALVKCRVGGPSLGPLSPAHFRRGVVARL